MLFSAGADYYGLVDGKAGGYAGTINLTTQFNSF